MQVNKKIRKKLSSKLLSHKNWEYQEELALKMFMIIFDDIPFVLEENLSGVTRFLKDLKGKFNLSEVFKWLYAPRKSSRRRKRGMERTENQILLDLKNKIMIYSSEADKCYYFYSPTSKKILDKYVEISRKYAPKKIKKRNKGRVHILSIKGSGIKARMTFVPFKLKEFNISIEDNYTDDFKPKSDEIIKCLNEKEGNGIVILHGEAGTGKTYYLKHLCHILDKKVLYIPPALVEHIVAPDFIRILGRYKNSVLIIEDADNILRKRDMNSNMQDVSSLLNITDGILNDVLSLQIVTTFNTNLQNIDEAFLRRGRLIAEHKFEKLPAEKVKELNKKLGFDKPSLLTEPMTLADIYNQEKPFLKEKTNGIGFVKSVKSI